MNQQKVLLVAINAKYIHSNLAIYSLKANAGKYAGQVELAEYTINHQREDILRGIYQYAPDVVGFSCYIWNIHYVLGLAEDLRKILPDITILLGGPEVSYDAPCVLEQNPAVDAVMVGEGENTFREFLAVCLDGGEKTSFCEVAGLCLRGDDGESYMTAPREALDMDELVFAYRDTGGLENRIIYYETMRGCPFSCSYCLSSVEKKVRMRSLSLVFEELRFFLEHKVKQVKFVDRTFNCNHEHASRIWEYIGTHDNGITNFHFEIGGDLLQEEDFELLRGFRPGLVQFEIGVQSANPDTLEAIQRKTELSRLRDCVQKVHEGRNIHQHLDLIAGLPYEDYASFARSFNEVYTMKPDQLQLGFLKILKGSLMEAEREKYGILYGKNPPYEVLATRWLSYGELLKLKRVEEMVEVYYNSFQFTATMNLLETCHKDAFSMYESLGDYYEKNGYFEVKHSRLARYGILWDYVSRYDEELLEQFRQTLTYDWYLRDYVKSPPEFVRMRSGEYLKKVRAFLDKEVQQPDILSGYEGYAAKQLFNMVYMDEFTLDLEILCREKKIRMTAPYTLLFDYRQREPLSNSARVVTVSV